MLNDGAEGIVSGLRFVVRLAIVVVAGLIIIGLIRYLYYSQLAHSTFEYWRQAFSGERPYPSSFSEYFQQIKTIK
ncbi:MAG: hypothetical protein LBV67_01990 [Streptococcaceae bacterium]|nr:hypothetical protein [Streptococcaceae bacterium]